MKQLISKCKFSPKILLLNNRSWDITSHEIEHERRQTLGVFNFTAANCGVRIVKIMDSDNEIPLIYYSYF